MWAAVFEGAGKKLDLRSLPDPTPAAGEVIIKVHRCGICGSDLHMTSGHGWDYPAGSVLGHEFAGEVVALGSGVETVKTGDRITAIPATGCGRCGACVAGYPLGCAEMKGMIGGYAEYVRAAASSALVLPRSLSLADGALVEPLAVGLHGVALAQLAPGARVVVLGAGAVGLAAIFWARRLGAGRIVAMAPSERRAAMVQAMGADAFVTRGEGDAARVQDALGGAPDLVLECAGAVGMLAKGVELLRPNGLLMSLGFCPAPDAVVPALATWKQVRIGFSMGYTLAEFQFTADTLDAGHVEPRHMITETISLGALPDMFESLRGPNLQTKVHVNPLVP